MKKLLFRNNVALAFSPLCRANLARIHEMELFLLDTYSLRLRRGKNVQNNSVVVGVKNAC
jgi:hypothetical protein